MLFIEDDRAVELYSNFASEATYTYDFCADPGMRTVVTFVSPSKDGLCCDSGSGYFKVYLNGIPVAEAPEGDFFQLHVEIFQGSVTILILH